MAQQQTSSSVAEPQARFDSPSSSANFQARSDLSGSLTQPQAGFISLSSTAQSQDRFYSSSTAQPLDRLYSPSSIAQHEARFNPTQQAARFDPHNLVAQQQARYYSQNSLAQFQAGFYSPSSIANSQAIFHPSNVLPHFQPSFYYPGVIAQQMLMGSNMIPSGYSYPFNTYNLNSAYANNAYFNINGLHPMNVNHPHASAQQAVGMNSPSAASANISAACNIESMQSDSRKTDNRKTRQIKRKQKENEPTSNKSQPRKRRRKQDQVDIAMPNNLDTTNSATFPQAENLSSYDISLSCSTSSNSAQSWHIPKESLPSLPKQDTSTILQQRPLSPLQPSTVSQNSRLPPNACYENDNSNEHLSNGQHREHCLGEHTAHGLGEHTEHGLGIYQKCENESFNGMNNAPSIHNYNHDGGNNHGAGEMLSALSNCNEKDTSVIEAQHTFVGVSKENLNYRQTSSEDHGQHTVNEPANKCYMSLEQPGYDLRLHTSIINPKEEAAGLTFSHTNYDTDGRCMLASSDKRDTFYHHHNNEAIDLSSTSSNRSNDVTTSQNIGQQTKADCDTLKQAFASCVGSSTKSVEEFSFQSGEVIDKFKIKPNTNNKTDFNHLGGMVDNAENESVSKPGEDITEMCAVKPELWTASEKTGEYVVANNTSPQYINRTQPVTLVDQITKKDDDKTCFDIGKQQDYNNEKFQGYYGNGSTVPVAIGGPIHGAYDFTSSNRISGFNYHSPISHTGSNYYASYTLPINFTDQNTAVYKNENNFYQKENSPIPNCDEYSTSQRLYIDTQEFHPSKPQFDSPEEVQVYPSHENNFIVADKCERNWHSPEYDKTINKQLTENYSDSKMMQQNSFVSNEKDLDITFSKSSYKTNSNQEVCNVQISEHLTDAQTGNQNFSGNCSRENYQNGFQSQATVNESSPSSDDFDSKWEIIYNSDSTQNFNGTLTEPSHKTNHNMQQSKQISDAQTENQNIQGDDTRQNYQHGSQYDVTSSERNPTCDDFDSKWEIIYSSDSTKNLNGTLVEPKLELANQIMTRRTKHSNKDKMLTEVSILDLGHHDQPYKDWKGLPQYCSSNIATEENNDNFKCTSVQVGEPSNSGIKEDLSLKDNTSKCSDMTSLFNGEENSHNKQPQGVSTAKDSNANPNTVEINEKIQKNNNFDISSFNSIKVEVINKDLKHDGSDILENKNLSAEVTNKVDENGKDVTNTGTDCSFKHNKKFFTGIIKRSTKLVPKQSQAITASEMKQTQISSFFKRDNSKQNNSMTDCPLVSQQILEGQNKMVYEAHKCDMNISSEPAMWDNFKTASSEKTILPENGLSRLKALRVKQKTVNQRKASHHGGNHLFMSRGKQMLLKSQEQSAAQQYESLNKLSSIDDKTLIFKAPALNLKHVGCQKRSRFSQGCKRNIRSERVKGRSKISLSVDLRQIAGSKVCPSLIVSGKKYFIPVEKLFENKDRVRSNYYVIKVEDVTRLYKPMVSQMMITAIKIIIHDKTSLQNTGTPSSNLKVTTPVDTNKGGNNGSEKASVVVPALTKSVCDICDYVYNCTMEQHINSDKHQNFITRPGFYARLDMLISSVNCVDKMVQKLITYTTLNAPGTHTMTVSISLDIAESKHDNTNELMNNISRHDNVGQFLTKSDQDKNKFDHTEEPLIKSAYEIFNPKHEIQLNKEYRANELINKTLLLQPPRLNIINSPAFSRKRKNPEMVQNTVAFKQRRTMKKCCIHSAEEDNFTCANLSGMFENMNIIMDGSDKILNDVAKDDNIKEKQITSNEHSQMTPYNHAARTVKCQMRKVRLPKFIKVKKQKAKSVTAFRIPSPPKTKVMFTAASENLFLQCIEEMKTGILFIDKLIF